jgi:hypothetical protein
MIEGGAAVGIDAHARGTYGSGEVNLDKKVIFIA